MIFKFDKHNIALWLVIIGSFNWGLSVVNINLVQITNDYVNKLVKKEIPLDKVVYIIIAMAGLYMIKRDNFLPFLGKTVIPPSVIPLKQNKFQKDSVSVHVPPNSKVIYWASLKTEEPNPIVWDAYGDYSNSGVVMSDNNGVAVLKLLKGSGYVVPGGRYIEPHVHYRYELMPGKLSRIETVYL